MAYKEVNGDLIKLSLEGKFDVITHGCNCFCTMGAGIAPQMAKAFGCDTFDLELEEYETMDDDEVHVVSTKNRGDINKLGQIDYQIKYVWKNHPMGGPVAMNHKSVGQPDVFDLIVVNSYTQYHYGRNHKDGVAKPIDYEALTMCMRKINHQFKGKRIGLPWIGTGLAGGSKSRVKAIILTELIDCDVTMVNYQP